MNCIAIVALNPNMLVFIDEAAKDKWTSTCQYGWSMRAVWCCVNRCFVRETRFSILPAITLDSIIAHDIIEGPVNSQHFVRLLEEHVVCLCDLTCTVLTHLWYRCLSPTHILVPTVLSSWIIVKFTRLRRSMHLLKTCTICHQCVVIHALTITSLQAYFPPPLLSWSQSDWTSFLGNQGILLVLLWWLLDDHNCACLSEHYPQQGRRIFSGIWLYCVVQNGLRTVIVEPCGFPLQ